MRMRFHAGEGGCGRKVSVVSAYRVSALTAPWPGGLLWPPPCSCAVKRGLFKRSGAVVMVPAATAAGAAGEADGRAPNDP